MSGQYGVQMEDLTTAIAALAHGIATLHKHVDIILEYQRLISEDILAVTQEEGPVTVHGETASQRKHYKESLKEDRGYLTC